MNGSTITKKYNHCLLSNLRWHKDINEKKSCSQEKHEEEFHKKVILEKKKTKKSCCGTKVKTLDLAYSL